jgi:DNA repair protein RadC
VTNMYSIRSALADSISVREDSAVMDSLFSRYITPQELLNASVDELVSIKGISVKKAQQIVGTLKLARTIHAPKDQGCKINCPDDAFQLLRYEIGHLLNEVAIILCLDTKNRVISKAQVSVGSLSAAIVHPRELYKQAILRSSASIIFVHNHPSGDCTPSQEDIALSRRLKECGDLIGIELLDSLVISSDSYVSIKERGMI